MKKLDDDAIQRLIDEDNFAKPLELSDEEKTDMEAYKLLFNVLTEEPATGPSYYFSKKVINALQAEIKPENSNRFYISLGLIFIFSIALAFGMLIYLDMNYQTGLVHMVLSCKWIILLSIAGFFAIQYADHKLLMGKLPFNRKQTL